MSSRSPNVIIRSDGPDPSVRRTPDSKYTLATSAQWASKRGRIVSAGSSSAEIMITDPFGHGLPSGHGVPVLILDAMSVVKKLLPSPGRPTNRVSLARGMRPGHNQPTGRGSTSAKQVIIGPSFVESDFFF